MNTLHLTDTPADYLTREPTTAHAVAEQVRSHMEALQVIRAALISHKRIPSEAMYDLRKLAFHRAEAESAAAREDMDGAARHVAACDQIAERLGQWLASIGDDSIDTKLEQLEALR